MRILLEKWPLVYVCKNIFRRRHEIYRQMTSRGIEFESSVGVDPYFNEVRDMCLFTAAIDHCLLQLSIIVYCSYRSLFTAAIDHPGGE